MKRYQKLDKLFFFIYCGSWNQGLTKEERAVFMLDMMSVFILLSIIIMVVPYVPFLDGYLNIVYAIPFFILSIMTHKFVTKYFEKDDYYLHIIKKYYKLYDEEARYALIFPSRILIFGVFSLPLISLFISAWLGRLILGYEPPPEPSMWDLIQDDRN